MMKFNEELAKEEAVEWAKRVPAQDGDLIEIRQVFEMSTFPPEVQKAAESPRVKAQVEKRKWLGKKETDNPSVRYFALTNLLEMPEDSVEVRQAKAEIMETGVVPRILSMQKDGGYWGKPQDFYERSKYRGTVWQLIILAELGADGNDERVRKACEFILQYSQDRESGGFSYLGSKEGGEHANVLPCLTGNMVWSLIRLGYLDDMRIQQGIDWIVRFQRYDDRAKVAPAGWPYDKRQRCWRKA